MFFKSPVFASSTDGMIDSTYKYAWGENIGWINFGASNGNVHVTDSGLSGYALAENIGWIYLGSITNDGEGNLSGYAWSENTGWIKFNPTNGGVIINSSGEFTGSALSENVGWIIFGGDYKVKTDWRPQSARVCTSWTYSDWSSCSNSQQTRTVVSSSPSGCSGGSPTLSQSCSSGGGGGGGGSYGLSVYYPPSPEVKPPIAEVKPPIAAIIEGVPEILKSLVPEFLKPKPSGPMVPEGQRPSIEEVVTKKVPLAFQAKWQLLPSKPIREFVLAPLPKEIRNLAQKFPTLEKVFEETGIAKITDVAKLKTVKLTLPGLTKRIGLPTTKVEPGKFALPQGVPVTNLSLSAKQQLPTEIVFTQTGGGLIDFNPALTISDKGEIQQTVTTIVGKTLELSIKPDRPVNKIDGYIVFKSKNPQQSSIQVLFSQLAASAIFAGPILAQPQEKPVPIEEKLVLEQFEYTDPDGDGIYTAEIQAPVIDGQYEIITVFNYKDIKLANKELRLVAVVDPEGYVYEKQGDRETRIPGAIVSLFWLNSETKQYEIWPAKEYQQENPQTTDVRGTYSFLVPQGFYYLKVETPGYLTYDGRPFQVTESSGIHINIELKTQYWWLKIVDWKTILLAAVIILLLYNFYRDKIREKLMKSKNI